MFVPGIKSVCSALSEDDGYEYNYLCTYETREAADAFARQWAIEKTPSAQKRKELYIAHIVKEEK